MKLVGWEQLAAQGVSGRQVYKGVAGGSQRRGSVAFPVMIDRSRNAAGNHPLSAGRMTSGGRQLRADRSGSGDAPGRAQHTTFRWCIVAPSFRGAVHGCGSGSNYDRSRSGSFLLGCGFSVLACALASASLRRMELSRFWINRCFVSAIKRRHSGSGMASSFRMVLSTISLVCRSRINISGSHKRNEAF